jgi:hypothetical protein
MDGVSGESKGCLLLMLMLTQPSEGVPIGQQGLVRSRDQSIADQTICFEKGTSAVVCRVHHVTADQVNVGSRST